MRYAWWFLVADGWRMAWLNFIEKQWQFVIALVAFQFSLNRPASWGFCCCWILRFSYLLRGSKYWNYRVNIFIRFFVNLRTKSFLIFLSSTIFFKKRFTPHVFVYRTTSRKPTCLQAANAAKITAKYAAKSKTSIWSKYEYGEFIWKNTTEQNGLAFCPNSMD